MTLEQFDPIEVLRRLELGTVFFLLQQVNVPGAPRWLVHDSTDRNVYHNYLLDAVAVARRLNNQLGRHNVIIVKHI